MNELHLFAGAGGGILAGQLLGHRCVCAVEWEPYAQAVLVARQNDGTFPPFPIWGDVQTFDGRPWRGVVDIVAGGFPCQDISAAGKGAGIDGERSGMWGHMARIIGEVRPRYVFVENSPILTSRGLGRVLGDLAEMGFDAEWGVLGASDVGAPHKRERIWIVANARSGRHELAAHEIRPGRDPFKPCGQALADADSRQSQERRIPRRMGRKRGAEGDGRTGATRGNVWPSEPGLGRMANGMAHRVDRLKAIGNGQVPRVAATAFRILSNQI
ncbi:DNA cytosine methyltransferase [Pusillimonas sp. SM2304]|uniref:DNA cytosine methyltransferase n=1 Tax=Pusillimonas sp. SM2304 TaxID=3073241 RepID=UPI0038F6D4C6